MAKPRVREIHGAREVALSPNTDAIVTDRHVIVMQGGRTAIVLTLREAQVLAAVVGETERVNLAATL
jgi:hypothetical protein